MIPIGYMAKRVSKRPDWLEAERVLDIYSLSSCISADFDDYIHYWKHNGYWLFDSPNIIANLAQNNSIDVSECSLFYYEAFELQFIEESRQWIEFQPDDSFPTQVVAPSANATLEGYDVVSFMRGTTPECSPLSCNKLASEVETNGRCLLDSLDVAKQLLESEAFDNSEPGPFRIIAVYSCSWHACRS